MKHLSLFTMLLLCAAGCKDPGPDPSQNDIQFFGQPIDFTEMVTVEQIAPEMLDENRPQTAEELKEKFESLHAVDPEKAFIELIDWNSVDEAKRMETLGGLLTFPYSIGRKKQHNLNSTELVTIEEYCRGNYPVSEYNEGKSVPTTHLLEIEYQISEYARKSGSLDVGERDGKFYIYPNVD